ncbi:hypothetical protein [Aurantibacter aestuarii]|nr:hypothetical protein [Aurantibacter aestuarii]
MKSLFVLNCKEKRTMSLKHFLMVVLFVGLATSCKKDDDNNDDLQNQNIPNVAFDTGGLINTNLPQYNQMQFAGNSVVLGNTYGINGVVVYYAGGINYSAFELSDPSHPLSDCSNLSVSQGAATCNCDDEKSFSIVTGLALNGTNSQFPLKRYSVEVSGNIIRVFNN